MSKNNDRAAVAAHKRQMVLNQHQPKYKRRVPIGVVLARSVHPHCTMQNLGSKLKNSLFSFVGIPNEELAAAAIFDLVV